MNLVQVNLCVHLKTKTFIIIQTKFITESSMPNDENKEFPAIENGEFKYVPFHNNAFLEDFVDSSTMTIVFALPVLSSNGNRAYFPLTIKIT